MVIDQISFLSSCTSVAKLPEGDIPEFAFIGRSNVGKSSLINLLAGHKGLAKVSGTPGKTRCINHFDVQSALAPGKSVQWHLVDLPGYGFAKLPKTEREKIDKMIRSYIKHSENLALVFLLIDIRHEPQLNDLEFMRWMASHETGFVIVFTKADKISTVRVRENMDNYTRILEKEWSELPMMIITSASTREGKEKVLEVIGNALSEIA